jgi:hypothetical protein
VLEGTEPNPTGKHAGMKAWCQVLVLDKAADLKTATQASREYVEKRKKEDGNFAVPVPLKDKSGKELTGPANLGNVRGNLTRMAFKNPDSDQERYVVFAVVKESEGVLVLLCDCDGQRKDYWDSEFTVLLESLRQLKK